MEYGNDLAIFADSGQPVTRRGLAEDILYSYAWRQAIGDFDIGRLADVSAKVRKLDDSLSDIRDFSNDVVYILDELESLDADIPLLGRISAMDVIRESFDGVSEAEELIRSLNSELNALGDNTDTLSRASDWVAELELSSVSGAEARSLFSDAGRRPRWSWKVPSSPSKTAFPIPGTRSRGWKTRCGALRTLP